LVLDVAILVFGRISAGQDARLYGRPEAHRYGLAGFAFWVAKDYITGLFQGG
jgi:hypothetical protein